MSNAAQTIAVVGTIIAAFGAQAYWLTHSLDAMRSSLEKRIDGLETRLVRIEDTFLKDYGERITRIEERIER